jgi:hypothetical protein
MLGFDPVRVYVASCWRRVNSTIACSLWLRKKAVVQRRSSVATLSRLSIVSDILRHFGTEAQTDSLFDPAVE